MFGRGVIAGRRTWAELGDRAEQVQPRRQEILHGRQYKSGTAAMTKGAAAGGITDQNRRSSQS